MPSSKARQRGFRGKGIDFGPVEFLSLLIFLVGIQISTEPVPQVGKSIHKPDADKGDRNAAIENQLCKLLSGCRIGRNTVPCEIIEDLLPLARYSVQTYPVCVKPDVGVLGLWLLIQPLK